MQRQGLKILIILFAVLFSTANPLSAQIYTHRLQQADSLFEAKQYTQSLSHYETILKQKQFSPAMLLKMAYIEEGLNHVGQALYYLNLYYLATKDKVTLEKMERLSTKYNLEGYKASDTDRAFSFYHEYHFNISIALAVIIFLLFSIAVYLKRKHQHVLAPVVILFFFAIVLGAHTYFGEKVPTAIVLQPNTYLMNGPSSGASVVAIISAGHRVEVLGQKDVWKQIDWKGQKAYIREQNLLPVNL